HAVRPVAGPACPGFLGQLVDRDADESEPGVRGGPRVGGRTHARILGEAAPGLRALPESGPAAGWRARVPVQYVDNFPPVWTGRAGQSFFRTHPVDRITPGSSHCPGADRVAILRSVPRLRTASAACLHSLSTGLYTA